MNLTTRLGVAILALAAPALSAAEPRPTYAPLREAVSSLGAVSADGWLYVYGGHTGKHGGSIFPEIMRWTWKGYEPKK